jgi:hypothetical protein
MHLFEFTDQPWCPESVRGLVTDFICSFVAFFGVHRPMTEKLEELLDRTKAERIVDLCSGPGGPLVEIQRELEERGKAVPVVLSDKFPDAATFERIKARSGDKIAYEPSSVDARAVPDRLGGLRTLFEGLHHFAPEEASAILEDAARRRAPIAVFEITERSLLGVASTLAVPFAMPLFTPVIRPFKWSRLALTYLVPVASAVVFWDALVSNLRSYSLEELRAMTDAIDTRLAEERGDGAASGYAWEMGKDRVKHVTVTWLVGYPLSTTT